MALVSSLFLLQEVCHENQEFIAFIWLFMSQIDDRCILVFKFCLTDWTARQFSDSVTRIILKCHCD